MKYTSAAAFRQALEQRLKNEAASTGLGLARLRKRVAFELFLRRLLVAAPNRWALKGALALNFRLAIPTRTTKDIDLGRDDDEQAAIRDITAAQQLALDDYFTFAATRTYELDDTDEFSAVRFHVTAQLAGRTFEQFLVDIGFTDTITWTTRHDPHLTDALLPRGRTRGTEPPSKSAWLKHPRPPMEPPTPQMVITNSPPTTNAYSQAIACRSRRRREPSAARTPDQSAY